MLEDELKSLRQLPHQKSVPIPGLMLDRVKVPKVQAITIEMLRERQPFISKNIPGSSKFQKVQMSDAKSAKLPCQFDGDLNPQDQPSITPKPVVEISQFFEAVNPSMI